MIALVKLTSMSRIIKTMMKKIKDIYRSFEFKLRIGGVSGIYFAHALDETIRFSASSGGFCKSMLVYLLENEMIDAAIIVRTGSADQPLTPEVLVTSKVEDIISSRTNSVYAPVNPLKALDTLSPYKTYAMVGLPCHCQSLHFLKKRGIAKNIKFIIGLFCNHVPTLDYSRHLLDQMSVGENELTGIEYRGYGWPGKFTAYLRDGSKKQMDSASCWNSSYQYCSNRCFRCDLLSAHSDFWVCDPWNLQRENLDTQGSTLVLCRNSEAVRLIKDAERKSYLKLQKCSWQQFFRSQSKYFEMKTNRCMGAPQ